MIEVIKRLGDAKAVRTAPRLAVSSAGGGDVDDETVAAIAMAIALEGRTAPARHGGDTSLWLLAGRIQPLNRAPRF